MKEKNAKKEMEMGLVYIKYMAITFLITMVLLVITAFFWYKTDMSPTVVSGMLVAAYIISNFIGGWMIGKKAEKRKFLWGLLLGVGYFLVVFLISFLGNAYMLGDIQDLILAGVLCVLSGMFGGMVS